MARFCLIANWKMEGSRGGVISFMCQMAAALSACRGVEIVICPPVLYLSEMSELAQDMGLQLGGQNAYCEQAGPFTGEISPTMLQEYGCRYVLVGHSERRVLFKEDNALVAKKVAAVCAAGLIPIVCLGETREQRNRGETFVVLERQVASALSLISDGSDGQEILPKLCFAYEPLWAIGTGAAASSETIREVFIFLREKLDHHAAHLGQKTRLFYGGSVKKENAEALFSEQQVDGALVGGASLPVEEFIALCRCAKGCLDKRENKCHSPF